MTKISNYTNFPATLDDGSLDDGEIMLVTPIKEEKSTPKKEEVKKSVEPKKEEPVKKEAPKKEVKKEATPKAKKEAAPKKEEAPSKTSSTTIYEVFYVAHVKKWYVKDSIVEKMLGSFDNKKNAMAFAESIVKKKGGTIKDYKKDE